MGRSSRHQSGLDFFAAGHYEDAARELLAARDAHPTSELWNDWAAAEAACGRAIDALNGLAHALELDPDNSEARENLRQLKSILVPPTLKILPSIGTRPNWDRPNGTQSHGAQANGASPANPQQNCCQQDGCQQTADPHSAANFFAASSLSASALGPATSASVAAYFRELAALPAHDPALPSAMREALRLANSDSSFFVQQAYQRLCQLPEPAVAAILPQLLRQGERDYRYLAIAATHAIDRQDWARALTLLHAAADRNWADLFIERERMRCERLRHEEHPQQLDAFAGVADYLSQSFCAAPWENMEITSWGTELEQTGNVYFCCPAWMPIVAGNAREESVEEIWNSPVAREVRASILDGSYRFCSKVHCNFISGRTLPSREEARAAAIVARSGALPATPQTADGSANHSRSATPDDEPTLEDLYPLELAKGPAKVVLSYDRSCNLACPSCRTDFYSASKRQRENLDRFFGDFVRSAVRDARQIYMDGAGETFASRHSREVLKSLTRRDYPNLRFRLLTNGQLIDRRAYEEFDLRGRLDRVDVSIDAARPETYAVIRKGGTLKRLLDNVAFLDRLRQDEGEQFRLTFRFVISLLNYREIPEVIRLAKSLHLDEVEFSIIRQWGQFSAEEGRRLLIANPEHPQHADFVDVLASPVLDDPIVNLGSALEYRRRKTTVSEL